MMDFPSNPTPGQVYNSGTGPIYTWDGVAWNLDSSQTKTAERRNRIVNPAMRWAQESGGSLVTVNGAYALDQYQLGWAGAMVMGQQQVSVAGALAGFTRSRITVGTVDTAIAAGEYCMFYQKMEGSRIADFLWGTANAKQVVLRFGFKTNLAGTYSVAVNNFDSSRSYVAQFTISAGQVNTDTVQTFAIPGCTDGTWKSDNTAGMQIVIVNLACGATYTAPANGVWSNSNYIGGPGQVNFCNGANTAEVFDVGLYLDPDKTGIAPPFEVPDPIDDQRLCQRYFEITGMTLITSANGGNPYDNTAFFMAQKRAAPTYAASAGGVNGGTIQALTYAPLSGMRQVGHATTAVDVQWSVFARM